MTRKEAFDLAKKLLEQYQLPQWHVRLSTVDNSKYLGLCDFKTQTIFLNAIAIDLHPDSEVQDTIKHEIAHALTGLGAELNPHGPIWQANALALGCRASKCGLAIHPVLTDAIRSGNIIEVETEKVIVKKVIEEEQDKVTYKVKRITEKCKECGKDAIELFSFESGDKKYITLKCLHIQIKEIPKGTPYESIVFDGDNSCNHTWELPEEVSYKTICSKCDAKRPYRFQLEGMRAAEKGLALNKGFAIFDEMGLGKTIQGLGYVKFLKEESLPVLFVVKSGLKYQFMREIMRVLGLSYVPQIVKTSRDSLLKGFKTYIIGYDMIRNFDISKFEQVGIKLVILDECQLIKNPDSSRTKGVRELARELQVLPLSGTPWKNRGAELFPVFNLLDPKRFNSYQNFLDTWVEYVEVEPGKWKMAGIRNIPAFKEYIKDLCIRREAIEVMPEMPSVSRNKLYCEIPNEEQNAYDEALEEFVNWFNAATIGGEDINEGSIIGQLQRMRHIIGMAKIPFTVEHVKDRLDETDDKILIGVHHIDVGNILAEHIQAYLDENYPEIPLLRITSDMDSLARDTAQRIYNESPRAIMVASTLAAGEGLNLQTGHYGILHERQWNPANEEQFEGRMKRIGQKSDKIIMDYVHAQGTVDEHLDSIVEPKRRSFHAVMNHSYDNDGNGNCKICHKNEQDHNVHWDGGSIMKELAESLVRDRNKNRKHGKKKAS